MGKCKCICKCICKYIYWVIVIITAVLLVCSLFYLIINFKQAECEVSTVSVILQSCIMGLTALIALKTYIQSRKVENAKAILEIKKMLTSDANKEIHKYIDEHKSKSKEQNAPQFSEEFLKYWENNKLKVYDYLGTLELLNIFMETGIIDEESFEHQYGYRLRNIIKYDDLLKKIEYQNQANSGWSELIELLELAGKKDNYKYPKFKL